MIEPIERLIAVLARLPGLGRRSAERVALRLVQDRDRRLADELMAALHHLREQARVCHVCGAITTVDADPCRVCTDPRRDARTLCVVEESSDLTAIEESGAFSGRYHVLGARLSPMRGEGVRDLRLDALLRRVRDGSVEEVVLALDTDAESEATAHWLAERLAAVGVRVSRIACGLPVGSGIAYSDPQTLQRALVGRQPMTPG